jgi:Kinesin motor domain
MANDHLHTGPSESRLRVRQGIQGRWEGRQPAAVPGNGATPPQPLSPRLQCNGGRLIWLVIGIGQTIDTSRTWNKVMRRLIVGVSVVQSVCVVYSLSSSNPLPQVLAYGPTGAGKTHTMMGTATMATGLRQREVHGIIPQAVKHIFRELERIRDEYETVLKVRNLMCPKILGKGDVTLCGGRSLGSNALDGACSDIRIRFPMWRCTRTTLTTCCLDLGRRQTQRPSWSGRAPKWASTSTMFGAPAALYCARADKG